VFVQDSLQGLVTVVVRQSAGRFAFYRGKTPLGGTMVEGFAPATPAQLPGIKSPEAVEGGQSLDRNLRGLNLQNSARQMQRLEQRFDNDNRSKGVKVESVK